MSDKLQILIDSVGIELWDGYLHLTISELIDDGLDAEGAECGPLTVARSFFLWTLKAHWNEACLGLAKVFDRRKDTATLRGMIKQARAQAGMFVTISSQEALSVCRGLSERVTQMNKRIAPLLERRNKVIGHLEATFVGKPVPARIRRIPYDDSYDLYGEAISITNDLARAYKGQGTIQLSFQAAVSCKEEFKQLCQTLLTK